MKYILPFDIEAPSIAYHNKAFPLGIMKANLPDFDTWICNKRINSIYETDKNCYNLYDDDIWSYKDKITTPQSFHITPKIFLCPSFDIVGIVKDMVNQGNYVFGQYNELYVPSKSAYQKYDFVHDYLIFGYDDENHVFKSAGYLSNQKYELFDLKYDDYLNSVKYFCFSRMAIYFHQIDCSVKSVIDMACIKTQIMDYLMSRKSVNHTNTADQYGVSVWKGLASRIVSIDGEQLDIRAFRAFMEHKSIMLHRLRKLSELGFIPDHSDTYNENVASKASIVYALSLKHNATHKANLLMDIASKIDEICLHEEQLLSKISIST